MIGFVKIKKFWFQHVDFSWNEKLHFIFSSDSLSQEPLLHSAPEMDNTVTLLLEKLPIWCVQTFELNAIKNGLNRDLNPGPLAPKARIIPLDHWALKDVDNGTYQFEFYKSSPATF